MNIVVDDIVAVLKVLALGDAVRRNQDVDILLTCRAQRIPPLGDGGEAGEHRVQVCAQAGNGRLALHRAGDLSAVQAVCRLDKRRNLLIEVIRRIGKRRKDEQLAVARVDGVRLLVADQLEQGLQLGVVLRRNIAHHRGQQLQILGVLLKLMQPRGVVHVGNVDTHLFADREEIRVLVVVIKVRSGHDFGQLHDLFPALIGVNDFDGVGYELADALQSQLEGVHGRFQSLEQVDAHQPADTFLAAHLGQAVALVVRQVVVLGGLAGQDEVAGRVDGQVQQHQDFVDVVIMNRAL